MRPAQNRRFASVYPRWRGEHSASVQAGTRYSGLSPLARGTLCYPLKTADSRRFIPAGAGNTRPASRLAPDIPVYPRWRGEHFATRSKPPIRVGLSPLARGTLGQRPGWHPIFRFIPAGAGNTVLTAVAVRPIAVYPRWRGEHIPQQITVPETRGLSPLARGTLHANAEAGRVNRFIPAGAGNTLSIHICF